MTKEILVVSLLNVQRAQAHFRGIRVCVVTESRHLSGFIGGQESDKAGLAEKVTRWSDLVEVLAGVAR